MNTFHAVQRTDPHGNAYWVHFSDPQRCVEAWTIAEVLPALRSLEQDAAKGLHAVGWLAYEAAPAFDPHYLVHADRTRRPLLRFTLYREQRMGLPPRSSGSFELTGPEPALTKDEFSERVILIRDAIARGETYQVNFTYPLKAGFRGDPWTFFRQLRQAQSSCHQAYFEESDQVIVCASPERFFKHTGNHVVCKPMKGTAAAGGEHFLRESLKNRSENIMIVDMIRNDLGKIADPGSVSANPLFEIESYPSVVQMTSTVSATGSRSPVDWLSTLFPCASITGAPKRKTMEWIHVLEAGPRGIYTGCIGGFYGDGVSEFSVAIRTAVIQPAYGTLDYHCGCGIVWDSDPADEYRESILKSGVLKHRTAPFNLIETMRFEPETGIRRWPLHRQRLLQAAAALGIETDAEAIEQRLAEIDFPKVGKVRLTLSDAGKLSVVVSELPPTPAPLRFRIDSEPTPSTHPHLSYKTSRRAIYEQARDRAGDVDETLLINERGELMEFTIGNLVWTRGDAAFTPPLSSGMLPGVARAAGLAEGRLTEKICRTADLEEADEIYLINALRGWVKMCWIK